MMYQRYYYLFKEGELDEDVVEVGGKVFEGGYERDNWWVICIKVDQNLDNDISFKENVMVSSWLLVSIFVMVMSQSLIVFYFLYCVFVFFFYYL